MAPDWYLTKDGDVSCLELYERHYSCYRYRDGRKRRQFVGPGETIVLRTGDADALFVWRKFIDDSGQQGVNCAVFRNEGRILSSELIRQADAVADYVWPSERHYTYVDPKAVRSSNPGYCFVAAGWRRCGMTRSGLIILERVCGIVHLGGRTVKSGLTVEPVRKDYKLNKTTIELDIPTDPAERVRRQEEYNRMKAPLPAWLGPDTPERREQLQMFVDMLADDERRGVDVEDGETITEESPAVLRAMVHFHREDARLAREELTLSRAHRAVIPVVTMQVIADAIVKSAADFPSNIEGADPHELLMLTPGKLKNIIMSEFDKELG